MSGTNTSVNSAAVTRDAEGNLLIKNPQVLMALEGLFSKSGTTASSKGPKPPVLRGV